MPIVMNNRQRMENVSTDLLKERGETILSVLGVDDAEVVITLVSDRRMTVLNRDFRGYRKTTDVLSFPIDRDDLPPGCPPMLGDVIISTQKARVQATARSKERNGTGYSFLDELTFLMIHGILHLVGFDHMDDEDAESMESRELELFRNFADIAPRVHHEAEEWN